MPSKLGIHGILPGETTSVIQQLLSGHARMTTVKAVADVGWLKSVKALDPAVQTVGRFINGADPRVNVEGPSLNGDLRKSARDVMNSLLPKWSPHRAYVDYWEIVNEYDPEGTDGHKRLSEFMMHCMDIANAEGYKLALFSYSLGVPEWEEIEAVVETGVFNEAKQNGHALSLHEYAYPMDKWYGEPLPGQPAYPDRGPLACRWRWWYEDFLIPRNEVVPLFLTEVNLAREMPLVTAQEWIDAMAWYDEEMRKDYYVIGAHLFTLGGAGAWPHFDFARFLPYMIEYMVSIKSINDPVWVNEPPKPTPTPPAPVPDPVPTPPVDPDPVFDPNMPRVNYSRHYLLLPPEADWRWINACRTYWERFRVTIGGSGDDAAFGPNLDERAVTAINPGRWPSNLKAFFDQYYPGVRYDPIVVANPEELAAILNYRVAVNKRFG